MTYGMKTRHEKHLLLLGSSRECFRRIERARLPKSCLGNFLLVPQFKRRESGGGLAAVGGIKNHYDAPHPGLRTGLLPPCPFKKFSPKITFFSRLRFGHECRHRLYRNPTSTPV